MVKVNGVRSGFFFSRLFSQFCWIDDSMDVNRITTFLNIFIFHIKTEVAFQFNKAVYFIF